MERTFVVARIVFLLGQIEPPNELPAERQRQSVQTRN
jgi:hypothetical protein